MCVLTTAALVVGALCEPWLGFVCIRDCSCVITVSELCTHYSAVLAAVSVVQLSIYLFFQSCLLFNCPSICSFSHVCCQTVNLSVHRYLLLLIIALVCKERQWTNNVDLNMNWPAWTWPWLPFPSCDHEPLNNQTPHLEINVLCWLIWWQACLLTMWKSRKHHHINFSSV